MGGFAILPKNCSYKKSIFNSFEKREFNTPIQFKNLNFDILYYPKFNGVKQYVTDKDENVLFVYGSLWYNDIAFENSKDILLDKIITNTLNEELLTGTFTLVFFNEQKDGIKILHDANAVNRFYFDGTSKIISSSWLSLVWLEKRTKEQINYNAIAENLILGFNIGKKTFINSIERIKLNDNLPKNIEYTRLRCLIEKSIKTRDLSKSIRTSIKKLQNTLNPKLKSYNKISLGISGGHDSRLLLGTIDKNILGNKLSFFTFYKPKDKDLEIAKIIAHELKKKIEIIKTNEIDTQNDLENIYYRAFLFFDGQCGTLLQYSKNDYTKKFRDKLLDKTDLHLSGVGGEIFRNYNHQPRIPLSWEFWIDQFLFGGNLKSCLNKKEVIENIKKEIRIDLGVNSEKINFEDRKKFYGNIFLSDWHGIRNSIENQYANYYSPFTDINLINYSYQTIRFHGSGGEYESEMINKASPELAKIKSGYGYNFSHIPLKFKIINKIRCLVKLPSFASIRKIKTVNKKDVDLSQFEYGVFHDFKKNFNDKDINFDLLLNKKKDHMLMVSYALNTLIKQV